MANNENDEREWEEIRVHEEGLKKRRERYKARKPVSEADLKLQQYFGLPKYSPGAEA
jgi:hypothetical protein